MRDLFLAAALLFSDSPVTDQSQHLSPSLQRVALREGLLDDREKQYVLAVPETFKDDVALLRMRRRHLRSTPPLSSVGQFPTREVASAACELNKVVRGHWFEKQKLPGSEGRWYRDRIEGLDRVYRVWDHLRDARCEYYYVTVRRAALEKLRADLGDADFVAGVMPEPVPLSWFTPVD